MIATLRRIADGHHTESSSPVEIRRWWFRLRWAHIPQPATSPVTE